MPGGRRDWHDHLGALTVAPSADWPADEVAAATKDAARLAALARTLVDGVLPASCGSPDRCVLAAALPRACDLARVLAGTPAARALPPTTAGDAVATADAFLDELRRVGSAVYVCRRVLHPIGECLFGGQAHGPARSDLCGQVLLAAHRLGGSRRH